METDPKDQAYISFLEVINKSQNVEGLINDALKIIYKTFNASRVLIGEILLNANEILIEHEYFEGNQVSMLKFKIPLLPDGTKNTPGKSKIWEYQNITSEPINKYQMFSLTGISFQLQDQKNGILFLAYKEKNKKLSKEEITFLITLVKQLEIGIQKTEKYTKSIEESERLIKQNIKLREQDHLRIDFINNITHELKTPLASILGFSKILINKNPTSTAAKEIADQIQQSASRLSTLVSDFLQINKLNSEGRIINLESTDIGELIKSSVEEFISLYNKNKISYQISDNYPILKTDKKLVRQVLDNLIINAIKYSPNASYITVTLDTLNNKKDLKISVIDEGIGIDKGETSKIFNRFYRSSNQKVRDVSGSGLGLSICKEIISLLKGTIQVESELGKGSKFSFTLPIN